MRKPVRKETKVDELEMPRVQPSEMQVIQTVHNVHSGMVNLFHVDFPFFSEVKVLEQQLFLLQLTQRMRNDLKKSHLTEDSVQLRQINKRLLSGEPNGSSQHFAFYNPQSDTLYFNETMIARHPEKLLPVCAHELAEKLLSIYISLFTQSSTSSATKLYFEITKTHEVRKLRELLVVYVDAVFATVFKEGCCEAIAIQTLRNMHYSTEAKALEKELLSVFPKCVSLLERVEEARKNWNRIDKIQSCNPSMIEKSLFKDFFMLSQIIKAASYYLGYALAKEVLEKYRLQGVKFAIENSPPVKAQYFANPRSYLVILEKSLSPKRLRR